MLKRVLQVLNGAIPNLVEFGPYSYMETKVKVNVTFSPDGTLATYYPWVCRALCVPGVYLTSSRSFGFGTL